MTDGRAVSTNVEDIIAIQQLISRYAIVVDAQDWDALDPLFTNDAQLDFSTFGGPVGSLTEIKQFLAATLPGFARTQHMMGLPSITLDGDRANSRTSCNNPMLPPGRDGSSPVWLIGLWYDDELVRGDEGWKFRRRTQTRCYTLTGFVDSPL